MIRPGFVPPLEIRKLRDLTRYRADLVAVRTAAVRTAEKQRVEKLLEDAQIKLSVVATDIFGVSGREMLGALVAGERDPEVLAQMARRRLRAKHLRAGGGVHRVLHRSPRVPGRTHAVPGGRDRRRHRRAGRQDRGGDHPLSPRRWPGLMRSRASTRPPRM